MTNYDDANGPQFQPYNNYWLRKRMRQLYAEEAQQKARGMTGMQLLAMAGADRTADRYQWQKAIVNRTWTGNHRYTE